MLEVLSLPLKRSWTTVFGHVKMVCRIGITTLHKIDSHHVRELAEPSRWDGNNSISGCIPMT